MVVKMTWLLLNNDNSNTQNAFPRFNFILTIQKNRPREKDGSFLGGWFFTVKQWVLIKGTFIS